MRKRLLLLAIVVGLILGMSPAQAKGPLFFEKILIKDDANDFQNGALDLDNVYLSEIYAFDEENNVASDRVVLRIETTAFGDLQECQAQHPYGYVETCQVRYDAHFRVAGADKDLFAIIDPPMGATCCKVNRSNTAVGFDPAGVKLILDRTALGLFPGLTIDHLYVTSSLVAGPPARPQQQAGDRAPGANNNLPYDQASGIDTLFAEPFTLAGTYEFFTIEARDGLHRDSVGGQSVRWDFKIAPTAGVREDTIRIRFDVPKGWSVSPSRGSTGLEPKGLLTGLSEGTIADFALTASANDLVNEGDQVSILMRVYSSSQGFKMVPLTVRVTGAAIDSPDYVFHWGDIGGLKAGRDSHLRFQILDRLGQARLGLPVEVDFLQQGRRVATVPAVADDGGYRVDYAFPSAGTWTVDAKVLRLEPHPHGALTIEVAKSAGAPGLGWLLVVGVLVGTAATARRP
jgi:hypothetical protein